MSQQCSRSLLTLCMLVVVVQLMWQSDARCVAPTEILLHGMYRVRRNVVRVICDRGYSLQGLTLYQCSTTGRLIGERPVCAKSGCTALETPAIGQIVTNNLKSIIICDDGFVVAGNSYAYCQGSNWDRPLGICRPLNHTNNHACDFETEDLCGWSTTQLYIASWRRVGTVNHFKSYATGPYHDHTHQHDHNGHYMLMESIIPNFLPQYLMSPIYPRALSLKTACCFRFHYFMYGQEVGKLLVLVRPKSVPLSYVKDEQRYKKLEIVGNQGLGWISHTISIDEMPDDFQIVFAAQAMQMGFGDIAIDDVQLMTGTDCDPHATTSIEMTSWATEANEPVVYAMESCDKRCGQPASTTDRFTDDGKLIKSCSCTEICAELENCCLDYVQICADDGKTTEDQPATTTIMTTTPMPTTTTMTTTIKHKPTTTTTTTTRRPTTITTTTTRTTTTTTAKAQPTSTTTATTTITTTTTKLATTSSTASTKPTIKTTTTTAKEASNGTTTFHKNATRIFWKIDAAQLEVQLDERKSYSSTSIMFFTLLAIFTIIVVIVVVRNRLHTAGTIDSAVSYKPNLTQRLKNNTNNALLKVRQVRRRHFGNAADNELLCNIIEEEHDGEGSDNAAAPDDDSVIYEEMGSDVIQLDDTVRRRT